MRRLPANIANEARTLSLTCAKARRALGKRWFDLAHAWSRELPPTKAARLEAVKALRPRAKKVAELTSLAAIHDYLERLAELMRKARTLRPGRPLGRIRKAPSLAERAKGRVRRIVRAVAADSLRAPERDDLYVRIAPEIGLTVSASTCRPYGGAYKYWSAKEYERTITVASGYLHRVARHGLAACGGLLTLDAEEVAAPAPGIRVFAAAWLVPGRGFEASVRRGYIALSGGENFHAATIPAAVAGVRRKLAAAEAQRRAAMGAAGLSAAELEAADADRPVTVRMARALGFCLPGIQGWCALVGIDPQTGATGRQVIEGYRRHPRREAARFIRSYLLPAD